MALDPGKLALALWRARRTIDAAAVPLALGDGTPQGPVVIKLRGCGSGQTGAAYDIGNTTAHARKSARVGGWRQQDNVPAQGVAACHRDSTAPAPGIGHCAGGGSIGGIGISACQASHTQTSWPLKRCAEPQETPSVLLSHCASHPSQLAILLKGCKRPQETPSALLANCVSAQGLTAFLRGCQREQYQHAVRPPCEYYPLPLPPPPPDQSPCRLRPPSDQLPLAFLRVRARRNSAHLSLPLRCWDAGESNDLPILPGYIMHNTITAEHAGQTLQILALTLKTDVDSYCWQGDITLAPADFAKLNIDGRAKGDEAIITLRINGRRWDIMAEDYRDTRRFVGYTYTVTGRSITAKLGADYTAGKHKRYDQPRYARQIADEQLQYLPYQIVAWDAVDWLVSGDAYTVSGQTPIAVIADIARAAGAFVESHPHEPQLFIRPLWRRAAWEKPTPERTIPANLILSASGQRRVSERCNAVRVVGSGAGAKGALVWRQGTDQTPEAGILTHALYTDDTVLRAAGLAALSETGTHKLQTVVLPWAEKYQLPLAELGKVWAFVESGQTWQGVIKGIEVSVTLDNDAPVVTQTVTVDQYAGE
ncbi:MAG: hypothetical protein Q4A06_02435 [Cardiobacteriaceae bacterium]|nr:hypothetical protein [Cardiobacteriaceae bacterium]